MNLAGLLPLVRGALVMACLAAYVGGFAGLMVWAADQKGGGDDGR